VPALGGEQQFGGLGGAVPVAHRHLDLGGRELRQVGRERVDDDLRQRQFAVGRARLWRAEERRATVYGAQLPVDPQRALEHVYVVEGQADGLAVAQAGPRGQDHEGAVARRDGIGDRLDDLGVERVDVARWALRQSGAGAR
jgi:hypothetical protein